MSRRRKDPFRQPHGPRIPCDNVPQLLWQVKKQIAAVVPAEFEWVFGCDGDSPSYWVRWRWRGHPRSVVWFTLKDSDYSIMLDVLSGCDWGEERAKALEAIEAVELEKVRALQGDRRGAMLAAPLVLDALHGPGEDAH